MTEAASPLPSSRLGGTEVRKISRVDIGLKRRYAAERRLDRQGTIRFTDTLVRVFSNDFGPLRHARGAALFALDLVPPLRNWVARRMMFGARAWP